MTHIRLRNEKGEVTPTDARFIEVVDVDENLTALVIAYDSGVVGVRTPEHDEFKKYAKTFGFPSGQKQVRLSDAGRS
jgi:hypothetical protein